MTKKNDLKLSDCTDKFILFKNKSNKNKHNKNGQK